MGPIPRTSFLVALALALLCSVDARSVRAQPDAGVVLVVGKALPKDRATVGSAVRSAARSGGWELVETPLAEPEVAAIVGCLKAPKLWACISPVVAGKGIQRLVVIRVDPDRSPDGIAALALSEHVLLAGSDVTTADQRFCQKCLDESLARIAFDLTKTLLEEAASGTGRTKLRISSTPTGAWITLDNTSVGLTDHTYATFPGRHIVIVQREGFQTETRTVDVVENQDTSLVVALRANAGVTPGARAAHPHLLPGIIAGSGLLALAAGVVWQRTLDPPDAGPQPRFLLNAPIVALSLGGTLAIGVGAALWFHASHQPPPASMPTAALSQTGAFFGWSGLF
jgi:hypothetical protein